MLNTDKIKAAVSALDVCEKYGIEVNRAGFARCPFHAGGNERTPSMRVWRGDRGYFCFSCHSSGDSIALVQGILGISFSEAVRRLDSDFNLGLNVGGRLSRNEQIRANKELWERRKAKEKVENEHRALIDEFNQAVAQIRQMEEAIDTDAPPDRDAEWSESFCYALATQSFARQRADEALEALENFEKKLYARS